MAESEELKGESSKAVARTSGPRAEGQVAPTRGDVAEVGSIPVDSNHVGALLDERADARTVSLGDVARAALHDARENLRLLGDRLDRERDRCEALKTELAAAQTKIAVLETQIAAIKERRRLKSWMFGLGGVMAGTGLSAIVVGSVTVTAAVVLGAGVVMMWIGRPGQKGEE